MSAPTQSKLYSFIDNKHNFSLTFFEGQKLIQDLAIMNELNANGLSFLRNAVLSAQHIIQLFKNNEQLGLYIDSDIPKFTFKLEANPQGQVRTLLLPEELPVFPAKITGKIRIIKTSPSQKTPYQSIIDIEESDLDSAINRVLDQSYQITARVILSDTTDQSIFVSKLPFSSLKGERPRKDIDLDEYLDLRNDEFESIFSKNVFDDATITAEFEKIGLDYLKGVEVEFTCPCSKELMISNLLSIANLSSKELFPEGESQVEIRCDYCKKQYDISLQEIQQVKKH